MKKSYRIAFLIVILILLCIAGTVLAESQVHVFQRLWDDIILDNRNIYLSCDKLPTVEMVEQAMAEHDDTIQAIEAVNPGMVQVMIDTMVCPGRAALWIQYPSHQDRVAIERLIGGDLFYGIPYRLQNY